MKKYLYTLIFCCIPVTAQWQADVRLTFNSAISNTSFNNARCIAVSAQTIHVVWYDNRDGNYEIYYKRSTDAGSVWSPDIRLTNNSFESRSPSISLSGSNVYVVWQDTRDGNWEIYFKSSTDAGVNWGSDIRLTNNASSSEEPSAASAGSFIHIVWVDTRDGNPEIYYKRSSDNGLTWSSDVRHNFSIQNTFEPSVAVSGSNVHVVRSDDMLNSYFEIFYRRSSNNGINWSVDTNLTYNSISVVKNPCIAITGSRVNVVWSQQIGNNYEIFFKGSSNGGINWGANLQLTNHTGHSIYPSIARSDSIIHIVWQDIRDGNNEIYYIVSTNNGITWGAETRLTNNNAVSQYPSVAISDSAVHVLWCDNRDGNYEIYYKRNPTGNIIGIQKISTEIPKDFGLYQNYPNPFNPETSIEFDIPVYSSVRLSVYDLTGREVGTLVNNYLSPGKYKVRWNAGMYSSGMYIYRIEAGNYTDTKKFVFLK